MSITTTDARWVRRYHPVDRPALRLACLPHAGGSAGAFHALSAALPPDVEALSIQYPGRLDRRGEPSIESIPALADQIARVLRTWTGLPLALFGHSMGATVAFEVTRRLEQAGVRPVRLFVSGRRAPSIPQDEVARSDDDAALVRELSELAGTDPAVLADPELLELVLPAVRSDYRAIETYRCPPGAGVTAPITALYGQDDPRVSADDAQAWSRHTTGGFDAHPFPGGHFYLATEQAALIDVIVGRLATTQEDSHGTGR